MTTQSKKTVSKTKTEGVIGIEIGPQAASYVILYLSHLRSPREIIPRTQIFRSTGHRHQTGVTAHSSQACAQRAHGTTHQTQITNQCLAFHNALQIYHRRGPRAQAEARCVHAS